MKSYPSIPHISNKFFGRKCEVFHKEDGSNIRVEWNHKKGFYKYGTRTQLLDPQDPIFGQAITAFQDQLSDDLERVMKDVKRYIAFFEFYGENSFAGTHLLDDPKRVKLFDINVHPKGFLRPDDYLTRVESVTAKVKHIETCTLSENVVDFYQVGYDPSSEGVVLKGTHKGQIWRTKIKTRQWLARLKEVKGENWKRYS